jgi:hypothetical protein
LFYAAIVLIDLIALIGMIGLTFKKYIFRDLFWKIFLILFIALEAVIISRIKFEHFWQLLYSIALILPAHYSIYVYAFKSNWKLKDTLVEQARNKKGEKDDSDRSSS